MTRFEKLPIHVEVVSVGGESIATIELTERSVVPFSMALVLLWRALVERLIIEAESGLIVEIGIDEALEQGTRAVGSVESRRVRLSLSQTEMDAWVHFLLKYHRDGMGEVDHLDVDVYDRPDGTETATVVLKVPLARPPMSEEDVKRRLGID